MDTPYLGMLLMFGGNFEIRGWAFCNGQLLSIAQNTALFSILGTTYGGDGRTTFALPDLRGRAPVGMGQGPGMSNYTLGQTGGTESVTLQTSNLPPHNHVVTVPTTDAGGTSDDPSGSILAQSSGNAYAGTGTASGSYGGVACGITGSGAPFSNLSPYLAVTYLIALQGIFPSRN